MKYFSGFCFKDEYSFFQDIVNIDFNNSDYVVCGFSFGAIKAFEFALKSTTRLDKLVLISPSFFNNKKDKFKKLQLAGFNTDKDSYIKTFLKNIKKPHISNQPSIDSFLHIPSQKEGLEQLEQMLYYFWDIKKLEILENRGALIEVYLGDRDNIVDTKCVRDFFMQYSDIFMIKNASHILLND